ncbi:MAG: MBOAT family O-acyltransferase, partial [Butyricicoccus sp.]
VYIPLGGNRGGTGKTLRNILIVWFCTGFWHGASWNFVLWGLYFAGLLILEKYALRGILDALPRWAQHGYTLFAVLIGWGIFAIEDIRLCGQYLAVCFGAGTLWSASDGYTLRSYGVMLGILVLAATTLGKTLWVQLPKRVQQIASPLLVLAGLLLCTAYLVDSSYNPFLYFRF